MEANTNNWTPPPGEFIKDELDARGWSQRDLAYILGVPEQGVNMIISGKRGITHNMAKALGEAFDMSADFFSNLQKAYGLARASDPDPGISRRARLHSCYPIRDMFKRGWLEHTDIVLLEGQITRFFEVNNFNDVPHIAHAAKSTKYDHIPSAQLAWLFRVKQIARTLIVPKFSAKALEKSLSELKQLLVDPEGIRQVPRILMECGVRFVLVESLPGSKIDGVCFWLNRSKPVIGMSLRFDRIDNFWFVLRHEIEHVLKKHGQDDEILDDLTGENTSIDSSSVPKDERFANYAAANFCVDIKEMNDFYNRKGPIFSVDEIIAFSRRIGIHEGLVVGQIQHRSGDYRLLRDSLIKIRKFLLQYAPTDGWGNVYPITL